jgi:predicted negative regulator of RcsB-dependent stress response
VAQHILRKDLKTDEIREKFLNGVESVASHQQLLWIVVGVALVAVLASFGWSSYTRLQTAKAAAAMDDATKVFQAPIRASGEPAPPESGEITYIDEKNKYHDAEQKFLQIANQYGRTRPGQIARYYAALSEEHLKLFDAAEKNLKQLDSSGDESLAGLARFQLAWVYTQSDKGSQAVVLYKQLADKPTIFVPKPMVLLALADYYRKANPAQASEIYNQVKREFSGTPAAEQADQGLELLNAKS